MIQTSQVLIMIVSLIILIVLGLIFISKKYPQKKFNGKYPEGYFVNKGIGTFIGVGIVIGLIINSMAIGVTIGTVIGVVVGFVWEKKAKKEKKIRSMTKQEEARKNLSLKFMLLLGILMLIISATILFARN